MTITTPTEPPRTTGTKCGHRVEQGMLAYPCSLSQGHHQVPPDDPEPHYAVEVGRSVREWQAWSQRRAEKTTMPLAHAQPDCPSCGGNLRIDSSINTAWCENEACPVGSISIAVEKASPAGLQQRPGQDSNWEDVTDLNRIAASKILDVFDCPRTVDHDHHYWGLKGEVLVYQCKGDIARRGRVDFDQVSGDVPAGFAPTPEIEEAMVSPVDQESVPTKQREGDQRLPDAPEMGPDDFVLYIADVEGRRQVGIERYGQAHRPFNGRNTLQDAYEEILDLGLYLRSLLRQAETDRDMLVYVVRQALIAIQPMKVEDASAIAVDRIMGWVASQRSRTVAAFREELRQKLIDAPTTPDSDTYIDGYSNGLSEAINVLDRYFPPTAG